MPLLDPWFYALAVPAVLITGVSKGGFGVGLGIVAVPMMALRIPAPQAAAMMLPVLCLMDLVGLFSYRARWDRTNMRIILPAGLAGIGAGALLARVVSARAFALLVGLVAVGFTLDHWLRARRDGPPAGPNVVKGAFWAAVSGFTSFVAHAGGPPLSVYLLPQRLDKTLFVGTTIVFFAAVNYAKLVPYAWLGQFDAGTLLTTLVLSPLAPLGMQLGIWLHRHMDPKPFYRVCYLFVFLAGLKLIGDAVR